MLSGEAVANALSDCHALVTRGLGPRLIAELAETHIPAYLCCVEDVDKAADLFAAGVLPLAEARGVIPDKRP